jgi:hypothetical protein
MGGGERVGGWRSWVDGGCGWKVGAAACTGIEAEDADDGGEAAPQPHLGHVRLDDRADDDELRHEKGDEALPQALPLDDAELAEDGEHEELVREEGERAHDVRDAELPRAAREQSEQRRHAAFDRRALVHLEQHAEGDGGDHI